MKNIGINILWVLFTITILGCNQSKIDTKSFDKYISDNFINYKDIREALIDTLIQWKEDSLVCTSQIFFDEEWQVDSILLFNRDSTRLFTTINERNLYPLSKSDKIEGIVGARIENKWHFHFGASRIVTRNGYKNNVYTAMSFEELGYISHTRIMSRLYKKDKIGQYIIDYNEMDNYFYKAYKSYYPNINKIDSLILKRISDYSKKKLDANLIERGKEQRTNVVSLPEAETNSKSWWDRLFGKEEVGLFESEAWKNRRKK